MAEEKLVKMLIPSLVSSLLAAERKKGSALTRKEVEGIRDGTESRIAPVSVRDALAENRGYDDIDAENAWEEWQRARISLNTDRPGKTTLSEEWLAIVPSPSLVDVLRDAEEKKGAPLTRKEVMTLRDNAESIVMTFADRDELTRLREYPDIDPENAWKEWQRVRKIFFRD